MRRMIMSGKLVEVVCMLVSLAAVVVAVYSYARRVVVRAREDLRRAEVAAVERGRDWDRVNPLRWYGTDLWCEASDGPSPTAAEVRALASMRHLYVATGDQRFLPLQRPVRKRYPRFAT